MAPLRPTNFDLSEYTVRHKRKILLLVAVLVLIEVFVLLPSQYSLVDHYDIPVNVRPTVPVRSQISYFAKFKEDFKNFSSSGPTTIRKERATATKFQFVTKANVSTKYNATDSLSKWRLTPDIVKIYRHLQHVKSKPLRNSGGKSWDERSFCHKFLINTFNDPLTSICGSSGSSGSESLTDSIKCRGNKQDPFKMMSCTLENIALSLSNPDEKVQEHVSLLNDQSTSCLHPSATEFEKTVKAETYQRQVIQKLISTEQTASSICEHWIDKLTFFYTVKKFHVYFRFLDWYNLHKSLWENNVTNGDFLILRISNDKNSRYPLEVDRALFPEVITLYDLPPNSTVCFKKVVLVPPCFSSVLFRCKMNQTLGSSCFSCNGKNLSGTPFDSFRLRVLQACSINDSSSVRKTNNQQQHISIISRTPYIRHPLDKLEKFKRVLTNEQKLMDTLQRTYRRANVSVIHAENYSVCEQVRYAHEADVLIGVHGAGLVHLWWMRKDSMVIELEPIFERGNPTFRMMSSLIGREYRSVPVRGNAAKDKVTVKIDSVLREIDQSGLLTTTWQQTT